MELEDENEDRDSSMDPPGGDKVRLTKVHQSTEEFLRAAFTSVSNVDRRQLRHRFIVPDTPFTAAPRLDKVMAAECSKNLKSADTSLSRIQALFLDAVGPLSDLLDKVNNNTELSVEDMEGAVKAALTFIGNASSQCTALRRTGILDEYNKDLVSFSQESGELFASATNTLFGPSFPEKAAEHIKQLQMLRQARGGSSSNRSNHAGFFKGPPVLHTAGGANPTPCREEAVTLTTEEEQRPGSPSESADQVPMTRTSCTQIFNNKRICKPYNCSPFTAGLHEATDSIAVTSSGWEVKSLLTQLGSANHRQMGDRDSKRLSNSLCGPSSTGMQAKHSYILHRAKPSDSRRGEGFVRKGCSPSLQPTTSREFLLNSLSGTQERRSNKASDKFEKAKRVGSTPTLQNGGHEYPKGTIKGKRLDGEDRPQGCILHRPNKPCSSALSKVHGKSTTLPVYMPPIRPVLCSMGVHKSDETHINLPSKYGGTYDCLHRRHTSDGGVPSAGEGPPGGINLSADRPGVCHQYTEVDHNPSPTN